MTKHVRIITALLALIFCVSAMSVFAVPAFAESQAAEEPANPVTPVTPVTPEPDPEPVNPEPANPEPANPDPAPANPDPAPVTPDPGYVDPGNNNSGNNNGYSNDDSGNSGNNSGSNSGNAGSNNSSDNNSAVYYDSNGNEHNNQSDVYVGGGQTYVPPVSTAPSAPLIKSQGKIDVNELSKNDWNDIKASLAKANKNGGVSDGDDFSFIQKNTAKGDNGHLVLVLGIAMLVLSVAGFIYLIVSKVRSRKQMAAPLAAKAAGAHSAEGSRYRSSADYNDGYKVSAKKTSSKKASKFDTADLPTVSADKPKGGRRYRD